MIIEGRKARKNKSRDIVQNKKSKKNTHTKKKEEEKGDEKH